MQKKLKAIRMEAEVRQGVNDLYREHRRSVIHFDYERKTARLSVDGKDEGILIFGTFFEALRILANGAKTCTVQKVFERMKAIPSKS